MRRVQMIVLAGLLIGIGCQMPEERRAAIVPLPEDTAPQPYGDLLTRARSQALSANEALYLNKWGDLEDSAKTLEQTTRFLGKATAVPDKVKDTLPARLTDLGKEASRLKEAAKVQDVKLTNEILGRINLAIREMRAE